MKRYTMTPISRKSIKLPSSTQKINSRHSMAPEENKKRDIRTVRDKNYKQMCIDNVYKFLSENGFEGNLSHKMLHNPSNKDFMNIFKFIFSFIDDYSYSMKFEEDIIIILKLLKYPYASEITKSQLTAITPHIWPIVLSMLSWMVDLMLSVSNTTDSEGDKDNVERHFLEFVCDGYAKFMEGEEDDTKLEDDFEKKVQLLYSEVFKEIDERKVYLQELETELETLQAGFNNLGSLEQKRCELSDDLNSLLSSEKQLQNKKLKYLHSITRISEELAIVEKEVEELRSQQEELKNKIYEQKINPEDVKLLNKEKVDLYKELEKITPEKEKLMHHEKFLKKNLQDVIEEIEKYFYDFNNLRTETPLKIVTNSNGDLTFNVDIFETKKNLEKENGDKRQHLENCKINKDMVLNSKEEKLALLKDVETKIEFYKNKLAMTGDLYLKKKKLSEDEQKKSKSEMDKLERELLKLNIESNSHLVQSEQALHKAKISLDITLNKIKNEKEQISTAIFSFYNNMENYKNKFKRLNETLQSLR